MNFSKNTMIMFLYVGTSSIFFARSTPTTAGKNGTGDQVQFSGWKPMVKPEALSTEEFVEKLSTPKVQNSSDLDSADTKRSFILVYPPRPSGTKEEPQKVEPPQSSERTQNLPVRPDTAQSRHHRMMNFRAPDGQDKISATYQRPKFPPVANPPPIPEHALRHRKRIPPNFTPESTSQHQVQIQLLDGYIVPPSGGGASNNHAEKKAPQITTFPLNLNNVPEIRLLLPGDVHAQLNNLRQQPHQQQNRHLNSHTESQNSDGRNNNPQSDYKLQNDRTNIHSFESQRRPGRTVEYSNNRNQGGNANAYGNGNPQQGNFNQNEDPRKLNKDFSPPDPAVYPEAVNFPGQNNRNYQNTINNADSYNHVKTYSGDINPNDDVPNRGRFPEQPQRDNRFPISQTKIHDTTNGQSFPQDYGNQQNPVSDNRTPISQTTIRDSNIGQGFPQNYGGQQIPVSDHRTPISQTVIHDSTNGQNFPQNYGGQRSPEPGNQTPISQTKVYDGPNEQNYPQSYGSQDNPVPDNGVHTKSRGTTNVNSFAPNFGSDQNLPTGDRNPVHSKTQGTVNVQSYSPNSRGQQNPSVDNRTPVHSKTQGTVNVQNYSPDFRGQQIPSVNTRTPVHSKTQGTVNVQNYSPDFRGQQIPSVDTRNPVHSKTQGTVNVQNYSPDFRGQQIPSVDTRTPVHSKTQDTVNVQSYSPNLRGQQNPTGDSRTPVHSKTNLQDTSQNFGNQRNPSLVNRNAVKTHTGQVPIEPFQRTTEYERENFRPLSNNNRNYNPQHDRNGNSYPASQNHNKAVSGTTSQRTKINDNTNNNRNGYSNGWRAAQPNRGKQNYNPVDGLTPGKINFYSGNSGNQNRSPLDVQQNGQSGTNFNSFGSGDTHQKSHGSNFSPSSSSQDNRNSPGAGHDKSGSTQFNRDRRTSAEDFNTQPDQGDRKATSSQGSTDDIYFVPPVLSQEQEQIEPFEGPISRDTTADTDVVTPTPTAREDGVLIDQKDISEYVNVNGGAVGPQSGMAFARTEFCECTQSCAPIQRSPDENLGSSIREIARSLNADAFFDFVGLTDEEIENTLASDGSYTLFIPSNEAVSRLPGNLIDHWRENNPDLTQALLNHVVRDRISLDQLKLGGRMTSRANDATVFINNYNNEAVTVNGHRIVHGDVSAPKGGTIHVIDGTLCPVADQDIINTLRTCNKYDGFLTLADVTKLLDTMQGEGPYTVFLPSNEALTKIPADELAVLKENSTVLREFLEYHIVKGAYFSGDLKDGQYLTTLHDRQPIRMGVRADGCYRRLVEVNNSPLFKSDIPTKNGVIHVVDWILRPGDLKWCDGVVLP